MASAPQANSVLRILQLLAFLLPDTCGNFNKALQSYEPIVQDLNGSLSLQVNVSDEGYPKTPLKEARGHPIEQVIGELNERTLRSKTKQA
ncbi:hypothetical protein Tco_0827199 [Tanacetum coccineum]